MTKPQKASEDKGRGNLNKRVNEMRQHAEACEKRYSDMTLPQKIEENNQRARELTAKMAKTSKKKTKRCPNPVQKRRTPNTAATVAGVAPGAPSTGEMMHHRVLEGQSCSLPRPDIPCPTSTTEGVMPFSSSHLVNVPAGFDNLLDTEGWTDIDQLNLSDVELPNDDVIQQLLNTTDVESLIQDQESKEGITENLGEPNAQNSCLASVASYERQVHMTQQMQLSIPKPESVMTSQAYHRPQYDPIMQQQHLQHQQSQHQQQQQQHQTQPQTSQQQQQTQSHSSQSQHPLVPQIAIPQNHAAAAAAAGAQRSMQYQHDSELNALLQRNDHTPYISAQTSKSPGNPVTSMQDGKVGHHNNSPLSSHPSAQPSFNQQKMSKTPPNVSLVHPYKTEPMCKVSLPQHQHSFMPTGPAPAAYEKMNYSTRNTFPGNIPQTSSYGAGVKNEPFTLPPMQSFSRDYENKPNLPAHHPTPVNQMVNGTVASSVYRVPSMTSQGASAMYEPNYHQTRDIYYRNEPYTMQTAPQPHLQTPGYPCLGPGPGAGPTYSSQVANVHAQQHGPPQHLAGMAGPVPSNVSHYSPQPHFNVAHPQYPPQQVSLSQTTAHPSFQQPASAYGSNVYSMYNQAQAATSDPSHVMAYRTHDTAAHMPYP